MQDKCFFDTNLLIYLYSTNEIEKKSKILELLSISEPFISTQNINEFCNVLLKKFKIKQIKIIEVIEEIYNSFEIIEISINDIKNALKISERYKYSYFDSLVISSCFKIDCNILYTEDLQHDQIIYEKVKIINPFNVL